MRKLKMTIGGIEITAELFDTPTADAIYQNLPFSSTARTWGEEVYFDTPVTSENEAEARDVVEVGELAFWLAGNAEIVFAAVNGIVTGATFTQDGASSPLVKE